VLAREYWPNVKNKEKRAVTVLEHQKIIGAEKNQESRLYYELLWETGASQSSDQSSSMALRRFGARLLSQVICFSMCSMDRPAASSMALSWSNSFDRGSATQEHIRQPFSRRLQNLKIVSSDIPRRDHWDSPHQRAIYLLKDD
jgi:hypothetical protein